ncbi:hypothetical protein A3758_04165 [Oleiphilus sp. HI0118]|nr:hypothetical protein A3758_04165 [Oleiphilus sp. HI0118]KZZ80902.1 hypothetical protein A3767_09220 [Oleiphilus sp. HI0133]KZZ81811.1 hypothetical protein A3767_25210 [Oleiphilus sp. HI0133]
MDTFFIAVLASSVCLSLLVGFVLAKLKASTQQKALELELAEIKTRYEHERESLEALQARMDESQLLLREELTDLKSELAHSRDQSKQFEVLAEQRAQQAKGLQEQCDKLSLHLDETRASLRDTESNYERLNTSMEEREASHKRELETFNKQKEELKLQFQQLSNEILQSNSKALQEANKESLSATINPFKTSIEEFKKKIDDNVHRETMQRSELKKELESLKELNLKMTTEAHELSTALKGQKKLQGNWGELVLENVLERSGLQLGKDYKREVSFNTEEGRQRPDAVVYLPQDKHLIIDAKVSLNAYTRFVNSDDETERALALKEHVSSMRDRITELADRDYYKLPGMNSPEIVFMFVPIESAFVEALKADELLFQEAIANNVLVATPTTLLTSLNIVRQLWRYEDQNKHTAELAKKADGVFKKLNTFLSSFEGVKKGLDRAQEAYVKAEGQLVSGKANLVKQVSEFKKLAPAIKAELPEYFTDKAELEIDLVSDSEEPSLEASLKPEQQELLKIEAEQ